MPLKPSTLYDIPEGHRTRPYVIVKKDDDCLYGYPASTKKTKELISRTRFDVMHYEEKDGFNISYKASLYDSYFNLKEYYKIEKQNLIDYFYSLTEPMKERLYRKLICLKDYGYVVILPNRKYPPSTGDIIQYNDHFYYIFSISPDSYKVYPVQREVFLRIPIRYKVKNKIYDIDYYDDKRIPISADVKRIISLFEDQYKNLNEKILKNRKEKQRKKRYRAGDVVMASNKLHLIRKIEANSVYICELIGKKNSQFTSCHHKSKKLYYNESSIKKISKYQIKSYEGSIL